MKNAFGKTAGAKLFKRFVAVFIFTLLLLVTLGIVREYFKRQEMDRELAALKTEVENLEAKKKDFLKSIEFYQSDFFIEKEAREKFNLKKQGETVSVIPVKIGEVKMVAPASGMPEAFMNKTAWSNAEAWWGYFFGT